MASVLIPIGVMTVIYNLKPFWFAILGCAFFKEKLEKIEILAIILCFGALVLMTYGSQNQESVNEPEEK